ncbi:sporulation protein YpjB [Paenibacillus sp. CMAA1364]
MLCNNKSHPLLWLMVSFICIVMSSPQVIWATTSSEPTLHANELNEVAQRLYRDVVDGNLTEVRLGIQKVEEIFTSVSFEGLTDVEGVQALAESIVEMKAATAQASIQPQQWINAAAKLRLAADSLSNRVQPLWHQYYKVVREDLSVMIQQVDKNDTQALKKAYDSLQGHYELIRPAIIIQKKPYEVNMLDSWLSFAGGLINATTLDVGATRNAIHQGEELFNTLFGKKRDEPAFSTQSELYSYQNGIWIGGLFILTALVYVGYRKYQVTQKLWPS